MRLPHPQDNLPAIYEPKGEGISEPESSPFPRLAIHPPWPLSAMYTLLFPHQLGVALLLPSPPSLHDLSPISFYGLQLGDYKRKKKPIMLPLLTCLPALLLPIWYGG